MHEPEMVLQQMWTQGAVVQVEPAPPHEPLQPACVVSVQPPK